MTERRRSLDDFSGSTLERLCRAADDLAGHPGTVLRIPPGDYRIDTPLSRRLRQELMDGRMGDDPEKIMFTPYYPYDTALALHGARDCTIEAEGARLLLGGPMQAVELDGCQNVTLRGLSVDCDPKPFTPGRVTGQGHGYVELALPRGCGVTAHTPAPRIVPLDGSRGGFAPGCMESFSRTQVGANRFRYHGAPDLPPCVGGWAMLIHTYHYRPSIYLQGCEGVTLEGLSIHAQYGMGLLAYRCRDLLLRGVAVEPSAGAAISTNTDATHFVACDGEITLEDCRIIGSEDDGVNVHLYYYDAEWVGGTEYLLRVSAPTFPHPQVVDAPRPGEALALCDRVTLREQGVYTLLHAETLQAPLAARVVLDRPLAGDGFLLNKSLRPRLTVRRCLFEQILTRCLLIKAETAEISDCVFRNCPGTAIHIAPEPSWREGGPTLEARLIGNVFDRVGFGTYGIHGDASVLCVEGGSAPSPGLHGSVWLEGNRASHLPQGRPALVCSALGRLTLRENQFDGCLPPRIHQDVCWEAR